MQKLKKEGAGELGGEARPSLNRSDIAARYAHGRRKGVPTLLSVLSDEQRELIIDLAALSTRQLEDLCERKNLPCPGGRSGLSRRFKEVSADLAERINSRRFDNLDLAAVVMDGTEYAGETIFWAIGFSTDGQKVPLGFYKGTENHEDILELIGELGERGLDMTNALIMLDGHKGSKAAFDRVGWNAARQRCVVHRNRRIVNDHVRTEHYESLREDAERMVGHPLDKEELGKTIKKMIYGRLNAGWEMVDPDAALKHAERLAAWFEEKGLKGAAESLMKEVHLSLTVQQLNLPPELHEVLRTTNAIESAHSVLEEYRHKPDNWTDKDGDMRERFFAAGVAYAERSWEPVGPRHLLERVQLAVLSWRHENVEIAAENEPDKLILDVFAPAEGKQPSLDDAQAALIDLLKWADWGERRVELDAKAFERFDEATTAKLREWAADQGFASETAESGREVLVRPNEAEAAIAAEQARLLSEPEPQHGVDESRATVAPSEEMLLDVAERARELDVDAMECSSEELETLANSVAATELELASVEPTLKALSDADWTAIAEDRELARAEGDLPVSREKLRIALGAEWTHKLVGEAAFQGALLRDQIAQARAEHESAQPDAEFDLDAFLAKRRDAVGRPAAMLEGLVAKTEAAAKAKAAVREIEIRKRFEAAKSGRSGELGTPAPSSGAVALPELNAYRERLGERRRNAFDASMMAFVRRLKRLEPNDRQVLERLNAFVPSPWRSLNSAHTRRLLSLEGSCASTLKKLAHEQRDLLKWIKDAERTKPGKRRDAKQERADRGRDFVESVKERLKGLRGEIVEMRAKEDSIDHFLDAHPEAALHYAIQIERERRNEVERELEEQDQATTEKSEQIEEGAQTEAAIEQGAGDVVGPEVAAF